MAERDRPHLFIPDGRTRASSYTGYGAGGGGRIELPRRSRVRHGQGLAASLADAVEDAERRKTLAAAELDLDVDDGLTIEFESFPGLELALESLEDRQGGAVLLAVRERTDAQTDEVVQLATVHVPDRFIAKFLRKVEAYVTEDTSNGEPRHRNLMDRLAAIRAATIEALWTEEETFPSAGEASWWEIWLRRDATARPDSAFRRFAEAADIQVQEGALAFPDRVVVLARATPAQLSASIDVLGTMAELRAPRELADFFDELPAGDQAGWIEDLLQRVDAAPSEVDPPAVCLLDTGIQHAHPLLTASIDAVDVHTLHDDNGVDDRGHGTEMAGLALYGDQLADHLAGKGAVGLSHRLESVKILPHPPRFNDPLHYGRITAAAVAYPEIVAPDRRRSFSMAVTVDRPTGRNFGQPTSWSAAVDAVAAGRSIVTTDTGITYLDDGGPEFSRLILVSAGNIGPHYQLNHLAESDTSPILDPAHAWNALTVGAHTELDDPGGTPGSPVAAVGELSPYSRTSVPFGKAWPLKPDICMEGGNLTEDNGFFNGPASMKLLTTAGRPGKPDLLTTTYATSAATAQAAWMTAQVWAEYPALWPQTVRALLVHGARWTPAMHRHFTAGMPKGAIEKLVRRYGMGVPTLDRVLKSATNELTLVAERLIHPFHNGKMRELHWFDLPWPIEVLEGMGGTDVRLRVTLSHFVEPNPSRRGWKGRFRYASHGLRFALKLPTESRGTFERRLNKAALDEEAGESKPAGSDAAGWLLGDQLRRRAGSVVTDIWSGSAADLAARGAMAVFPVTGWWKELPKRDRSELGVRYAVVVSIEAPEVEVDLWTPVQQQITAEVTT